MEKFFLRCAWFDGNCVPEVVEFARTMQEKKRFRNPEDPFEFQDEKPSAHACESKQKELQRDLTKAREWFHPGTFEGSFSAIQSFVKDLKTECVTGTVR